MMANNQRSRTALITGATGFIGSHLTRRLVSEDWQVHIIIRPTSDLSLLETVVENIIVHIHDGTTENMIGIVKAAKSTIVFHLASLFLVNHTSKDIDSLLQSNISFATQLVEAMVTNKIYYLINTGTSWQHYENRAYSPVCLYAATKQAFEAILQFYTETTALKTITLKLFDTYGIDDPRPKLLPLLKNVAQTHQPLAMSPGEQLLDLVYIDDVVEAYHIAAQRILSESRRKHETFAVSSGSRVSLQNLIKVFEKVSGTTLPIEWKKRPYREREVMVPWDKGETLPGWKPVFDLEYGLAQLIK
jgi:nucleoside-diphosphate-sugar epimerase